jgi:hypothetical protein
MTIETVCQCLLEQLATAVVTVRAFGLYAATRMGSDWLAILSLR